MESSTLMQDLATVDSILLRKLPPLDDKDAVSLVSFGPELPSYIYKSLLFDHGLL